jgi:hypothetical protein
MHVTADHRRSVTFAYEWDALGLRFRREVDIEKDTNVLLGQRLFGGPWRSN